jgi:hypothetical protein
MAKGDEIVVMDRSKYDANSNGIVDLAEVALSGGGEAEVQLARAGPDGLTTGQIVYLHNASGSVLTADLADATDETKLAAGYSKQSYNAADVATIYLAGELPGSGFTPGAMYYLQTTPGDKGTAAPTASGNIIQAIGLAVSATSIKFDPNRSPIVI